MRSASLEIGVGFLPQLDQHQAHQAFEIQGGDVDLHGHDAPGQVLQQTLDGQGLAGADVSDDESDVLLLFQTVDHVGHGLFMAFGKKEEIQIRPDGKGIHFQIVVLQIHR